MVTSLHLPAYPKAISYPQLPQADCPELWFHVVLLGDDGVGKTALLLQLICHKFVTSVRYSLLSLVEVYLNTVAGLA